MLSKDRAFILVCSRVYNICLPLWLQFDCLLLGRGSNSIGLRDTYNIDT